MIVLGSSDFRFDSPYPIHPERLPSRELREGKYVVRFASNAEELDAVLRLRFEVFNLEMGEGLEGSFESERDLDQFDPVCHHLVVVDTTDGEVVGSYRLQTYEMALENFGFYSNIEFDLASLPGRIQADSVELGRACVALEHRSTQVLFLLWKGLALYVAANRKRFLFGCSSLTSQDPGEAKALMDHLEAKGHLHPELEVVPRPDFECFDSDYAGDPRLRVKVPQLFRIYLRHGAKVCGIPAIDREFKTIDFFVLFDVEAMPRRMYRTFFGSES